ncbi:MAG: NADPH azoreductase [Deltaproteobacteria bacterium ADurb.Bin510]|nr:MAG: NADPH azoreductase [Deltaproteobacteria bacterium ADurb.Bin510]
MDKIKIAIIVGSLRQESYNRQLAQALIKLGPPDFEFRLVPIHELPLYNQDDDDHPAESVKRFKAAIAECQGLIFVTPEYNRSMPGVLKNALDQGSRPYGQSVWGGKPAGVLGISIGTIGTALAQQHLRNVLAFLDVPTLAQPEVFLQFKDELFDSDGAIGTGSRKFLQDWLERYAAWVRRQLA